LSYFDGVQDAECLDHPETSSQTDQHWAGQLDGELKWVIQ